ncbi:hypothetical protein WH87_13180 [Devosia epidermidihirudinis]|uniref:Uncharacterized protein n=1 Tax=Devosia epidermidihirudinis TaxID=1293439 RepID=A0A0F5Q7I2_9HYPH|nr:hypothetical protein [Devosia epidermidihirudinis]KKC36596.1 hypothetical protein WH87_13180 [Devosia epidermidihirudinis]
MTITLPSRRRLAAIAAACLLSVALPAVPAMAQKTKTKTPATTEAQVSTTDLSVDIPGIDSVGSNLEDGVLRDIFSGNVAGNAEALAGLTATSISIPAINLIATITKGDDVRETKVTFNDVVLDDVTDGIAGSISLAGITVDAGDLGGADIGAMSANNFDIGGVLGLYGLVGPGTATELKTIYTDFTFEGGNIETPEVACTVGAASLDELKARPLGYSYAELLALGESLEGSGDPSPEEMGKIARVYANFLTAFESTPVTFDGFDCDGVDDEGRALTISVAGMTTTGMSPGIYPGLTVEGLDVTVEGDGNFSVGSFSFKPMDVSGPIAVINAAPESIDAAWFEDNARALFPAFEGFSMEALAIDVPDPSSEDERIVVNVGAFDLSLGAYRNGIPTDLKSSASNIIVDLPKDSGDVAFAQLAALGVTSIDAGFNFSSNWDEASNSILINDASISGVDLGSLAVSGSIINATEALFSLDENESLMAAMGLAIRTIKADAVDAGLSDLILSIAAKDQKTKPETLRPIIAGFAEGTVIGYLAGVAEAQKVGGAISAFLGGKAKSLSIALTAKDAAGLSLQDFMAAEEDPSLLLGKVTIDASAK